MFCKKCGKEVADGTAFCPNCGASLADAPAPVKAKAPAVGGPLEPVRANPLFLAAVICMSVVAFFQLIGLLQGASVMGQLNSILSMMDMGGLGAVFVLISLVAVAITGVIVAGLWLTWVSGLDSTKTQFMGLGLKLIWAGVLAQLIYIAVALGLAEILVLIAAIAGGSMASSGYYGYDSAGSALAGVAVLLLIVVGAVLALMIIYYRKALKTVKAAQVADATGQLTSVPSMFLVVVTFVLAGINLLGLLIGGLGNAMSALQSLADIGASVLFGIVMLQFRNQNPQLG